MPPLSDNLGSMQLKRKPEHYVEAHSVLSIFGIAVWLDSDA